MRYELDINGYVSTVFWGCESGNCQEYTGTVPSGYSNLTDWSEKALINAYYINSEGNLTLDIERQAELEEKQKQEEIDNTPIYKKDLYGSNEILDSQYQKQTATGDVLVLSNVKNIPPIVKLTGISCYDYSNINIYTQGYNMLKNDGETETIEGISFTKNADGSIKISGTATDNIEYNLSGNSDNASPIFVLKKGVNYFLNMGGYSGCEVKMNYYNGETTEHIYSGGCEELINLPETKKVTQVLLTFFYDQTVDVTIYPMLNYGTTAMEYESYKSKVLNIDFADYVDELAIYPSNTLYPSNDLYPSNSKITKETVIDYILIENGVIYISKNGVRSILGAGNVQLFNDNNTFYVDEDINIDMEYSINELKVEAVFNARIDRTDEEINLIASKKVGNDEIISKINQTAETITIDANKLNINGTVSANGNFKIETDGTMECTGGNIGGWTINNEGLTNGTVFVKNNGASTIYTVADLIIMRGYIMGYTGFEMSEAMIRHYDFNGDGAVTSADYVKLQNLIGISMS